MKTTLGRYLFTSPPRSWACWLSPQPGNRTTNESSAAKPQPKERGSVTRSSIGCNQVLDKTGAFFSPHMLRLTEPRSENLRELRKLLCMAVRMDTDEAKGNGCFSELGRAHGLVNSFAVLKFFSDPCPYVPIRG